MLITVVWVIIMSLPSHEVKQAAVSHHQTVSDLCPHTVLVCTININIMMIVRRRNTAWRTHCCYQMILVVLVCLSIQHHQLDIQRPWLQCIPLRHPHHRFNMFIPIVLHPRAILLHRDRAMMYHPPQLIPRILCYHLHRHPHTDDYQLTLTHQ
jgi:hypothetical protein